MRRLGPGTSSDVDPTTPPVLAIPVGSCEQHGPHLALDTDTVIATALAEALAEQRHRVLVAPAIAMSASGEHAGFAGTLSIGTEALITVLVELVRSADWAAGVVLVNGHGGNADALSRATRTLHSEQRRVLTWWPSTPKDARADAHAGWLETSVMLHLDPSRVHMELAQPGDTRPLRDTIDQMRSHGVQAVSPNGVLGDPTPATATDGAAVMHAWVLDLVGRFDAWIGETPTV